MKPLNYGCDFILGEKIESGAEADTYLKIRERCFHAVPCTQFFHLRSAPGSFIVHLAPCSFFHTSGRLTSVHDCAENFPAETSRKKNLFTAP